MTLGLNWGTSSYSTTFLRKRFGVDPPPGCGSAGATWCCGEGCEWGRGGGSSLTGRGGNPLSSLGGRGGNSLLDDVRTTGGNGREDLVGGALAGPSLSLECTDGWGS